MHDPPGDTVCPTPGYGLGASVSISMYITSLIGKGSSKFNSDLYGAASCRIVPNWHVPCNKLYTRVFTRT